LTIATAGGDTLFSKQDAMDLTATARDSRNAVVSGASIAWTSSDPSVVAIGAAAGGTTTAMAVANGAATITARSGAVSATKLIVVSQRLAAVTVTPTTVSLALGATQQLSAVGADARGNALTGITASWSSSDAGKATASAAGLVQATGIGTATITASMTASGVTKTGSVAVTVAGQQAAVVAVTPPAGDTLYSLGDTRLFAAIVRDGAGAVIADAAVVWSVDKSTVASVAPASGSTTTLTATGTGSATVTARAGSATGTALLNVRQRAAQIVATPAALTLAAGATQQLTVSVTDARNNAVPGLAAPTFTSSDPTKLTVSATGLVTAVSGGSATISVAEVTPDGTLRASVAANVSAFGLTASVDVEDFDFAPTAVDIAVGGTVTWTWTGQALHTVTSSSGNALNSPGQATGTYSAKFNTAGRFDYFCTVHPFMTGSVVVH
jgi:plastocyanin